jgi:hypothetical protein
VVTVAAVRRRRKHLTEKRGGDAVKKVDDLDKYLTELSQKGELTPEGAQQLNEPPRRFENWSLRAEQHRPTHYEGVVWVTAGNGRCCGPQPGSRLVMASDGSVGVSGDTLGTQHSQLGKCVERQARRAG